MMSPSRSLRLADGIPCTTSSLIDVHTVAGKPAVALEGGTAPRATDEGLDVLVDVLRRDAGPDEAAQARP